MASKKWKKNNKKRIFIIPTKLDVLLERESKESGRSRSDILRESLYVYFAMRQ